MSRKHSVILESEDSMEDWDYIRPVLEKFAARLGVDISVRNPHGERSDPIKRDGYLYIRFWSTPGSYKATSTREAFGIKLDKGTNGDSCRPSRKGIVIRDPKGTPVAELLDNTLYVLFDLPHCLGERSTRFLMQRIMEETERVLKSGVSAEITLDSRANFTELYRRDDGVLIMSPSRISSAWDELVSVTGMMPEVYGERISVMLGPITFIGHQGDDPVDIGRFEIEIDVPSAEISFYPLDSCPYQHPHVDSHGYACLGNVDDGMTMLIRQREYALAVDLARRYLEQG